MSDTTRKIVILSAAKDLLSRPPKTKQASAALRMTKLSQLKSPVLTFTTGC
jgi:hypothetical protein